VDKMPVLQSGSLFDDADEVEGDGVGTSSANGPAVPSLFD